MGNSRTLHCTYNDCGHWSLSTWAQVDKLCSLDLRWATGPNLAQLELIVIEVMPRRISSRDIGPLASSLGSAFKLVMLESGLLILPPPRVSELPPSERLCYHRAFGSLLDHDCGGQGRLRLKSAQVAKGTESSNTILRQGLALFPVTAKSARGTIECRQLLTVSNIYLIRTKSLLSASPLDKDSKLPVNHFSHFPPRRKVLKIWQKIFTNFFFHFHPWFLNKMGQILLELLVKYPVKIQDSALALYLRYPLSIAAVSLYTHQTELECRVLNLSLYITWCPGNSRYS